MCETMHMNIFVETLTGTTLELVVLSSETILSVKNRIQKSEEISVSRQHLIWQGNELDNYKRLRDYSISSGSTIRLVIDIRVGPLNGCRIPSFRISPTQFTGATRSSSNFNATALLGSDYANISDILTAVSSCIPQRKCTCSKINPSNVRSLNDSISPYQNSEIGNRIRENVKDNCKLFNSRSGSESLCVIHTNRSPMNDAVSPSGSKISVKDEPLAKILFPSFLNEPKCKTELGDTEPIASNASSNTTTLLSKLLARAASNPDDSLDISHLAHSCDSLKKEIDLELQFFTSKFIASESENIYNAISDRSADVQNKNSELNEVNLEINENKSLFVEDNDSLTDVEDYLFYYHTGDLLFGPPRVFTQSPPYSYYSVRDSQESNQDYNIDSEFQNNSSIDVHNHSIPSSNWKSECNELVEKVKNLKLKMKNSQLRRQNRKLINKNTNSIQKQSTNNQLDVNSDNYDNSHTASNPDCDTSNSGIFNSVNQFNTPILSAELTKTCNNRRRRMATVTPPDIDLLQTALDAHSKPVNKTNLFTSSLESVSVGTNHRSASNPDVGLSSCDFQYSRRSHFSDMQLTNSMSNSFLCKTGSPPNHAHTNHAFLHSPNSSINMYDSSQKSTIFEPANNNNNNNEVSDLIQTECFPAIYSSAFSLLATNQRHDFSNNSDCLARSPSIQKGGCAFCTRKLGLADNYDCRCGHFFCSRHRYAEAHACQFDYKAEAKQFLSESNPVVVATKLPKI